DSLRLIQQGLNSGQALSLCITNKSFDAYERSLIDDVIAARIPKDLTRELVFSGKTV
ncbi:MAG TPA: nitric-oxide reductase, partial [Oribacterium sp.]|nr:nitric-oxide reductase [Oribacterium sp.]